MLILSNTTDTLELVLAGAVAANQPSFICSYRDITATDYVPGRVLGLLNGATAVVGATAPAASTQRVIDHLTVFNRDTANVTLTVRYDANGTEYPLTVVTLAPSERLEYQEGSGFRVFTSAGSMKMLTVAGNNPVTSSRQKTTLGADVTNSNATANTIADVTGLNFSVNSGQRYWFRFVIHYTAAAITTGSRWTINGPASPTELRYGSEYSLTTTSKTFNTGLAAFDLPAASNASSAATTANVAVIEGFITPSAAGTVTARFASEIASSAIVAKAGSFVEFMAL